MLSYFLDFLTSKICCDRFLKYFGIHKVQVFGKSYYENVKNSTDRALVVFNHVLFTDIPIMLGYVDKVSFVGHRKHLEAPGVHTFSQYLQCIPVPSNHPRQNVTDQIIEHVLTRKPGQSLLAIAPDAAIPATPESGPISFFRSGAFAARSKVVPVVIRYFPEMPAWREGQTMPEVMKQRREGPPLTVTISILPAMTVLPGEDVVSYRERVRSAMTTEFLKLRPPH